MTAFLSRKEFMPMQIKQFTYLPNLWCVWDKHSYVLTCVLSLHQFTHLFHIPPLFSIHTHVFLWYLFLIYFCVLLGRFQNIPAEGGPERSSRVENIIKVSHCFQTSTWLHNSTNRSLHNSSSLRHFLHFFHKEESVGIRARSWSRVLTGAIPLRM